MASSFSRKIFSAVDALLLRPLPYQDPDRLVKVWEQRPAEGVVDNVVAPADFIDWARMNTVFEDMAAYVNITADMTGAGEPIRLSAAGVSPAFFAILTVGQPARLLRARAARDEGRSRTTCPVFPAARAP